MRSTGTPGRVREIVRSWRKKGDTIGFVPTMGALHEGHRSLLRRARRECDRLVASIFVNPLQFGPREDFARYPRPILRDRRILRAEGTDLLYSPQAGLIFPAEFSTRVSVDRLSRLYEGAERPGHFDGVATIVAKLLAAVEPDRLYLGRKDAQQAVVLRRMVEDLDLAVRVVLCPTVREPDGLAVSSRNAYLTQAEREWAPTLYRSLSEAVQRLRQGVIRRPGSAAAFVRRRLGNGPGRLDYVIAVDADDFGTPRPNRPVTLALAYRLPSARLIDNIVYRPRRDR